MTDSDSSLGNKRSQTRFLCIGIELLYSPIGGNIVSDVANSLLTATSHDISMGGMAFDIDHEMQIGEQLLVTIKSPDSANEMLRTEVRWCKALEANRYRVGVLIIDIIKQAEISEGEYQIEQLENTDGVPNQAMFICPACKQKGWFNLVGKQEGTPYPTILPLYNCSHCNTTRTIPSLLSFNRALSTED
ncbi:MAG: PilZ domain-containing protein [Gammaproteobacteria bacterium]|nr:PilZ domain-containing protein [Gammaproteobacteria bacterium]